MSRGLTGKHSLKLKALQSVFGRHWADVALEWAMKPLTQGEIAEKWTTIVSVERPDVRYSDRDVSDIIKLARCYPTAGAAAA